MVICKERKINAFVLSKNVLFRSVSERLERLEAHHASVNPGSRKLLIEVANQVCEAENLSEFRNAERDKSKKSAAGLMAFLAKHL